MGAASGRTMARRFALMLCLVCPAEARAGAWLQPEGQGQIIFNPSLMVAAQRFDRRGKSLRSDRFIKTESMTLIEYGFRENLTLMLTTRQRGEIPTLDGEPQRVTTSTLGFGARIPLWRQERIVVSAQLSGESGLERSFPGLPRRFGPRHEGDARLLAGLGFDLMGYAGFIEAQAGYRWRSGRHADEARVDLTLGVRPLPQLLVLLQSFNTLGLRRTQGDEGRVRQHKLQASAVLDLTERWSMQAGVFGSVAGRNALKERGVLMGVWRKF